jgi:hypothetical protein
MRAGGRVAREGRSAGGEAAAIDPFTQKGRAGGSLESPPELRSKPPEPRDDCDRGIAQFPDHQWQADSAGSAKQGRLQGQERLWEKQSCYLPAA